MSRLLASASVARGARCAAAPARHPVPERYSLTEAGVLLGVSASAVCRREQAGAITLERDGYGGSSSPGAELARHAASSTPRRGGRRPAVPDEVMARTGESRAAGLSYARIAAFLTLDGVPTVDGGRRWWASTVRGVAARRSTPGVAG
jgi:hypothetical protein